MEKKYIYIIMACLVLFLSIFIFWIMNKEKNEPLIISPSYSFIVSELGDISLVENEEAGLKFVIPQDWEVTNDLLASFSMRTKDFIPFKDNPSSASVPKKGCWIGATVRYEKEGSDNDYYFSSNKYYIDNPEDLRDGQEIIEVDGINALKEGLVVGEENPGKVVLIWIPINDKVYLFESDLFGEDQEECKTHFDNFLNTVSIKK
ncbi:MAG: hypothetical protein PHG37_02020 [Candidatus Pacebacteria bacterium]|nr:hypothetical protein [Candidatus Paceibacterota bacterium]MDD4737809.1 hypothetical protein [Candidatus Paceibacterota bacterium]